MRMAIAPKKALCFGWLVPLLGLACPLLAGCGLANLSTPEPVNITFTYPEIDNSFYVVGRDDRSIRRFAGKDRRPLEDLIAGIDCGLPVILMDHQPLSLHSIADNCIDIQLSGHTHHGQIWPYNFITSMIYEVSYGYTQIGNTHFYVSAGYGTWGPPIRTSGRPEIVEIVLHFRK